MFAYCCLADTVVKLAQILDAAEHCPEITLGDVKLSLARPSGKIQQPPLRSLMRSLDPTNIIQLFNCMLTEC